ncbi:hypothetical protein HYPBUDRAFT_194719 [Hyphopichia burtonii NRRL Y-1933]|uniref:Uncharacterized protein n=1 Tax=Hyphopichia burtonii NRRL Y-1933 TaxID=984485 RepID=A0A1E4RPG5_9ASCO|nr:hypothetical protein HYPBUDRAFT_194719 [Hyphopichia burtonii NRRL Y-1933]ODV69160.1 hypothetical protein HYPBUDRAFT_194719 [Hyphopichia burtonii NRRL Y-1933]
MQELTKQLGLIALIGLGIFIGLKIIESKLKNSKIPFENKGGKTLVTPVPAEFNWKEATPIAYRPYVGKKNFKVQMGIQNIADQFQNWLLIEDTYLDRVVERKEIIKNHGDKTLYCEDDNPRVALAVREGYNTIMDFMCSRYPQIFTISPLDDSKIYNTINGETFPRYASDIAPRTLLKHITENLEEDFLFLLKNNPDDHDEEYIEKAGIFAHPLGFDPSKGFNKPISSIHGPVPDYQSRLKLGMHRFFNRLEPKDLWMRVNWSIQMHPNLFSLKENHGRPEEVKPPLSMEEVDWDHSSFTRSERQIFSRLPNSRAIIFLVRTYLTPMYQIKSEGLGKDLAFAIDNLPENLAFYKNRHYWGTAVKDYLQS